MKFAGVSVATTLLDIGLFNALLLTDALAPVQANTLSYCTGIVASYFLNRHFTFAAAGSRRAFVLFVAVSIAALSINNLAVGLTIRAVGTHPLILTASKIAVGLVVWLAKFLAFKSLVFDRSRAGADEAGASEGEDPFLTPTP